MVQALKFYDQACSFAPNSPMVAYKRIRVLVATQRIDVGLIFGRALGVLTRVCLTGSRHHARSPRPHDSR